jgi:hypothetical protein
MGCSANISSLKVARRTFLEAKIGFTVLMFAKLCLYLMQSFGCEVNAAMQIGHLLSGEISAN